MTDSEAKEMLEAYMECDRRKNEVVYEKQCHEDCDNCELCYAQGTVGEHKEAVNMAIKALKKLEKIKWVLDTTCLSDDATKCYYDGDCRLHEYKEIVKIVRSDDEEVIGNIFDNSELLKNIF